MKVSQTLPVALVVCVLALNGAFGPLRAQQVVLPPGEPALEVAPPAENEAEDDAAEGVAGETTEAVADVVPAAAVGAEAGEAGAAIEGTVEGAAVGGSVGVVPPPPGTVVGAGVPSRALSPTPGVSKVPLRSVTPGQDTGETDEDEDEDEEERELVPLPERPINKEEDAFLPASYSLQRYAPTRSNSAFTREIIAVEIEKDEGPPSELSKYVLAGVGIIGGSPVVSAINAKNEQVILRSEPKEKGGVFVVSVNRGERMADSTVTISDGKLSVPIKFDPKRTSAAPQGALAMNTGTPQAGRGQVQAGAVGGVALTPQQQQQQLAAQQRAAQQQAEQPPLTPEQQQAQVAAQQQASVQLIEHLKAAAEVPAATPQAGGGDQPRRRRVVLPPSGNR